MYNQNGSQPINNCTFTGNSAGITGRGGGIFLMSGSSVTITNSILWGDTAAAGPEIFVNSSPQPTVTYSNIEGGYSGTGNINTDPLFVNVSNLAGADGVWRTADDGLMLLSDSPCIDAANGDAAPDADILGNARYDDPATFDIGTGDPTYVDIGAYEF
ncbi:hypothetical protein MUP29_01955 [bacterium]|nr:hypothetical protein [bacterium]